MTNYNNTDQIIKEKYEGLNPVFDAEAMWSDLSPVIEKRKRRGFIFWVGCATLVVLLSLLSYNLFIQDETVPAIDNAIKSNVVKSNALDRASVSNLALEDNSYDTNSFSNDGSKVSTQESDFNEEKLRERNNSKSKETIIPQNYIPKIDGLNNSDNMKQEAMVITDGSWVAELKEEKKYFTSSVDLLNETRERITLTQISNISIAPLEFVMDKIDLEIDRVASPTILPHQKNQWRLGLNTGYYIHSRSFSNVGDDTSNNFSSRSKEEKAKDGYDLGIKLEYFLSDHLVIIGGLRFSQSFVQRNANFAYAETVILKDHVVAITNTEDGPIEDKETITYDGVFIHKADNYITATRLGLITGLQYRVGAERWSTHVDLGVELPVWSSHSGVITNDRRPYNLSDDTEVINTSSLQIFGGVGVEYSLSSSTALQATIRGFMPLNNEHVESYAIEKKSALMGLNLGVHFRL